MVLSCPMSSVRPSVPPSLPLYIIFNGFCLSLIQSLTLVETWTLLIVVFFVYFPWSSGTFILWIHWLTCHLHNIRFISNAHYSQPHPMCNWDVHELPLIREEQPLSLLESYFSFLLLPVVSCFLAMWEIWYIISFLVVHIKSCIDKKNLRGHSVPSEM